MNIYGTWSSSILEDEDFAQELLLHLQGIGKYVKAMDIVEYLDRAEVKSRLKLTKTISLSTAQRWMSHVGYRWSKTPTGQFVDGHERIDVVEYRQAVFLPNWAEMLSRTRIYTIDGNEGAPPPSSTQARRVVIWNHDESTYYANDRRKIRWVHKSETAVPYAKGKGASLMVADMVSPDYGWLQSPDGKSMLVYCSRLAKIALDTSQHTTYSIRPQMRWISYVIISRMKIMSWSLTMRPLTSSVLTMHYLLAKC